MNPSLGRPPPHLKLVDTRSLALEDMHRPSGSTLWIYSVITGSVAAGLSLVVVTALGIERGPVRFVVAMTILVVAAVAAGLAADTMLRLPSLTRRWSHELLGDHVVAHIDPALGSQRGSTLAHHCRPAEPKSGQSRAVVEDRLE
jgi:hypothetical protein